MLLFNAKVFIDVRVTTRDEDRYDQRISESGRYINSVPDLL